MSYLTATAPDRHTTDTIYPYVSDGKKMRIEFVPEMITAGLPTSACPAVDTSEFTFERDLKQYFARRGPEQKSMRQVLSHRLLSAPDFERSVGAILRFVSSS